MCSWIVFSSVWYQQYSGAVLPPSVMVLFTLTVMWWWYINVWSWNTMSTTKTMLVHLNSVNLKGTLVATTSRICVFFCWTVTWPTSSTVWPFLSLRSRLCQEESQIDHIGCVGLKEIRSSAVCGGLGASYIIIILNPDSFSNLHSHLHSIVPAMIDASPSVLLFIHSIRACISHLPACY